VGVIVGRRSVLAAALAGALTVTGAAFAAPAALAALPTNCTQTGRTVTCSYVSTGAEQTFTVPTGVTSVQVTAVGGAGADGSGVEAGGGGVGGQAGAASGALTGLEAGSTLYLEVGGSGAQGGFNGGGANGEFGGGRGGGASDVRTSPRAAADSLATRVVVAAGGGGGGGFVRDAGQGNGGAAGQPGGAAAGAGGGAATADAGGPGGVGSIAPSIESGTSGTLGQGGTGGSGGSTGGGGGGGGGLYGGGAGAGSVSDGGGGGGGGSSRAGADGTTGVSSAPPSITISYAAPATAGAVTATSGDNQSAPAGQPFAQPLVATVTDPNAGDAPIAGAPVRFEVISGSASFAGNTTVTTDANGRATSPTLTAGATPGPVRIAATTTGAAPDAPLGTIFTATVTAAPPAAAAVTVKGGGTLTATDGQRYSISVNAQATAAGQASGKFALAGGGADTTASSRTVTSVKKTSTGGTVTGTAVTSRGQTVPFTLTVVDKPGGRDQVTVQLGGKTVTGTLTNGDITTS
jgi:hypothetical protein